MPMKKTRRRPAARKSAKQTTPPPAVTEEPVQPAPSDQPAETDSVAGFEASYHRFEGEAAGIADAEVQPLNCNAMVCFHNARSGAMAVLAERARIEADPEAPKVDFARIEATVSVGEAAVFAARRAANTVAEKSEIQSKTAEMFESRDLLASSAVAAVKAKLVKGKEADTIAIILRGKGPIDGAQDCIDLGSWFRRNASALAGKTAVTTADIAKAERLGAEVLRMVSPAGVEAATEADVNAAVTEAAAMRDRMGTLLARHHAYVARVGGWLWGHDVAEHVPLLRARSVTPTRAAPPAPPAPPAPL
jgi:hypothetical protein